ncbi:MAG: hypothetical protein WCR67_00730 [Bacilli bacterium]
MVKIKIEGASSVNSLKALEDKLSRADLYVDFSKENETINCESSDAESAMEIIHDCGMVPNLID